MPCHAKSPIGDYEIKPAGMRQMNVKGTGTGIGEVLAIQEDEMVGQVYFEVHPDHVDNSNVIVELYGNIAFGLTDCAESGTLLSSRIAGEDDFSWEVFPYPSYNDKYRDQFFECHPRATGAIMAATEFKIVDPFGSSSEGSLWFPSFDDSSKNQGVLQYCVRVIVRAESEESSYIDTKFQIEGNRNQENFGDIRIFSNQAIDSKSAYVADQAIEIDSFLCGIPGDANVGRLPIFGIGDTLSICVGPTEEYASDHKVVGFESVVCKNKGQTRNLIDDEGVPDMITVVEMNTIGHIDLLTATAVLKPGTLAVKTTITTGMVQLGDTSTVCTGEAFVEKKSKTRRDLQDVQELKREKRGGSNIPFTVTINLAKMDNSTFASSSSSSSSASSRRKFSGWALTGLVLVVSFLTATVG
jgi:hypothetical protein